MRKAIREYHAHGSHAAHASLESGLSGEYWSAKHGLTKAKIARDLLDTYIHLAAPDKRVAVGSTARTVTWAGHEIAANIDVLLSDPRGYVGRACLTGVIPRPLDDTDRALIAAAPLQGLLKEFEGGDGLFEIIAEIEVWELRTGTTSVVSRQQAEAAWPRLLQHLQRAIG
ncbi:MAG TPA: hypothetical protein VFB74_27155 [Kribbellaceae bacterium]|nr:hypothetical protein [Kribbellaceae bacterium]